MAKLNRGGNVSFVLEPSARDGGLADLSTGSTNW